MIYGMMVMENFVPLWDLLACRGPCGRPLGHNTAQLEMEVVRRLS